MSEPVAPGRDALLTPMAEGEAYAEGAERRRAVMEAQSLIDWYWGAVLFLSTVRFGSVRNEATQRVYLYCKSQMEEHAAAVAPTSLDQ